MTAHAERPPLPDEELERIQRIEELKDPGTYEVPELTCDVIMKGGITSGVVYPLAVAELATRYRFANIGGTSAGAIAAAAAAAAAANPNPGEGFAELAKLPERLGEELQDMFRPQTKARRLFRLAMLATVKVRGLAAIGKWSKIIVAALAFIASPAGLVLIGGAVVIAVALALVTFRELASDWWQGVPTLAALYGAWRLGSWLRSRVPQMTGSLGSLIRAVASLAVPAVIVGSVWLWRGAPWLFMAWLVAALVLLAIGVVAAIASETGKVLSTNDFGLVGGSALDTKPSDVAPLSEWLDALLRSLSGGTDPLSPLTFADLARIHESDADGGKDEAGSDAVGAGINLTLLTTCLSRGRTYYLPWDFGAEEDERPEWFFDPYELRRALPDNIVAYLCEPDDYQAREAMLDALKRSEAMPGVAGNSGIERALWPLRPLPPPAKLPVLMAARMSLSFPLLISAVPLRSIDWSLAANYDAADSWNEWFKEGGPTTGSPPSAKPVAEKCWFSDGGIISNFPVHLFDSMIPTHPTFGFNLRGYHPDRVSYDDPGEPESQKVFRPRTNGSGQLEWWSRWPETGWGAVGGFVGALKNTIQNWSDNDQMRVPGFRDRVVHVSHNKAEGGLNLAMPSEVINALGRRGHAAASDLIDDFSQPDPRSGIDTGWRNHKWIRFRSAMALLGAEFQALDDRYDSPDPVGVESYYELVRLDNPPSYQGIKAQRKTLRELVEGRYDDAADPPEPGIQGAAGALDARAAKHRGSDLWAEAPRPRPSLRIVPGHRDADA